MMGKTDSGEAMTEGKEEVMVGHERSEEVIEQCRAVMILREEGSGHVTTRHV